MKKIALIAAMAATMTAGVANAYNLNQEATGLVVPNVIHNATDSFVTTVGIVSRNAGTVSWVFFDENSVHKTDGSFPVTANDQENFVWDSIRSGALLAGVRGYLVFTLDIDNPATTPQNENDGVLCTAVLGCNGAGKLEIVGRMSGNAFQVDSVAKDVAFIPTIPLVSNAALAAGVPNPATADYVIPGTGVSLAALQGADIQSARMTGVDAGTSFDRVDLRYYVDGAVGGNDTNISLWTADELPVLPFPLGAGVPVTYTVNMYDTTQQRKSVNFDLPKANLNFVDVETIVGRPANFTDGHIALTLNPALNNLGQRVGLRVNGLGGVAADNATLTVANDNCAVHFTAETPVGADPTVPYTNCVGGMLAYSVVSSASFGAVQTMMAAHD